MISFLRNNLYNARFVSSHVLSGKGPPLRKTAKVCSASKFLLVLQSLLITRFKQNNGKTCKQVNADCTRFFFTSIVAHEWNKLPLSVILCSKTDPFKTSSMAISFNLIFTKLKLQTLEGFPLRFKNRSNSMDHRVCVV